jgi:hypothetical protein
MHRVHFLFRFCWDGLLDWTEDATLITALLNKAISVRSKTTRTILMLMPEITRQSGPNITHRFIGTQE